LRKKSGQSKASLSKILKISDLERLQSAYDTYARDILDRTMVVPGKAVAETVELARQEGAPIRKKPEEIYDNTFVNNLEKSGFMKEIWGNESYKR